MRGSGVDELALLTLNESYGLPVLMYAVPALTLGKRQTDELNACWNNVIRRIFGYNRRESVKEVIYGLGQLNVRCLIMLIQIKFYRHLYYCKNTFITSIFQVFSLHSADHLMHSVYSAYHEVVQSIYNNFETHVHS